MFTKKNYFMNVIINPWPFLLSIWFMNFFLSLNLFLNQKNLFFFFILTVLVFNSFEWWNNYYLEYLIEGGGLFNSENLLKMFMIIFILSEFMIFVSMFWSYLQFYFSPNLDLGMIWPPKFILMFDWLNIPMLNTLILISSSITVTKSHFLLNNGKVMTMKMFLLITIMLGLIFSTLQIIEYKNSFFSINDCCYGSSFFLCTGLHGIHVIIGSSLLFYNFISITNSIKMKSSFTSFEMSCWYWHFVDLIWIYLFYIIYFLS